MNKHTLRVVALAAAAAILGAIVVFGPVVAGLVYGYVTRPRPKPVLVIRYVGRPPNSADPGVSTGSKRRGNLNSAE